MKNLHKYQIALILIFNIILSPSLWAQIQDTVEYNIDIKYSGSFDALGDSLFNLFYVFNTSDLESFSTILLNKGKDSLQLDLNLKDVDMYPYIEKFEDNLFIEVGRVDTSQLLPQICFQDESGETTFGSVKRIEGLDYRTREEVLAADSLLLLESKPFKEVKDKNNIPTIESIQE